MIYDTKIPKTMLQVNCWTNLLIYTYLISSVTISNNSKEKQLLGTKITNVVNTLLPIFPP